MLLMPLTTATELSCGVDGDDGELVATEADDHVHEVAGLDDRADARDLVDLDRHGALGGRDLDVDDLAGGSHRSGWWGDLRAGRDRLARRSGR